MRLTKGAEMRKRRMALGIGVLLLICAGVRFLIFPPEKAGMEEQFLTEQDAQALTADREETQEELLTDLIFAGEALPCDREAGIFYLPVDMDRKEWEAGSFSAPESSVKVYLLDNPFADAKQEAVREGKSYRLLAVKGERFRQYAVVFSGLPILCIDTDSGTEIRYEEAYGTMRLYHADTKENWVTESLMSAHIRGGSSRLNPKKSYKMTLYKKNQTGSGSLRKNNKSLLGMREDNEWLIYAMYSEDSKVRDKLSLEIWNNSGALSIESNGFYGYHMEYMEVIQNGEHWGIYGLMEPVDYKQLDLTKENEAQPEEYLYKQKDAGVFELKGRHTAQDESQMEVLNTYLAYLEADDSVFAEEMPKLIDVDNALEVWLYLQAVMGMDNIERNIFYPAVWEDGQYRLRFLPWDMDYSWGNVHDFDAGNRTRFSEEILTMRIAWKLGDRLIRLDVDHAQDKVRERWKELRATVYADEELEKQIDAYAHQVIDSGAFGRDEAIWLTGGHLADYDKLKKLACDRMAFLDEWMEEPLAYLDLEEYVE